VKYDKGYAGEKKWDINVSFLLKDGVQQVPLTFSRMKYTLKNIAPVWIHTNARL